MGHYCGASGEKLPAFMVAVFSIGILLLGCRSSSKNSGRFKADASLLRNTPEEKAMYPPNVALAPGDVLEVKFFYTPELNELQTVRPDGKIALQLVGEVEVEGKSPAELRSELMELYSQHLKTPEIAVMIRSFYERRVYVGGQVMAPGIIEMPGTMTLLEAIMQAGGFNVKDAEVRNVIVIRHINGQRYGQSIDMKPALSGDEVPPFYLAPKDIVYVPQTTIAKVDQWVDQHINKIIPDTGFNFRRTMGNTSIGMGSYR
jgi:protein involved in polysaccharide export with SLBB domain